MTGRCEGSLSAVGLASSVVGQVEDAAARDAGLTGTDLSVPVVGQTGKPRCRHAGPAGTDFADPLQTQARVKKRGRCWPASQLARLGGWEEDRQGQAGRQGDRHQSGRDSDHEPSIGVVDGAGPRLCRHCWAPRFRSPGSATSGATLGPPILRFIGELPPTAGTRLREVRKRTCPALNPGLPPARCGCGPRAWPGRWRRVARPSFEKGTAGRRCRDWRRPRPRGGRSRAHAR